MADENKYKAPVDKTVGDYAHTVAKAGISGIPLVGGPAAEVFAAVVAPPLEKRRNTWMQEVGEGLRRLEDRGKDLAELRENEEFIDIAMSATAAALKTANARKRTALKNAVLNTAAGSSPEESLAQVFVALVDRFTEWHLKILKVFQNPALRIPLGVRSVAGVLVRAYPELESRRPFYEQVWRDLYQNGLVDSDSDILFGGMTPDGALAKRTTKFGDQFLAFVSE